MRSTERRAYFRVGLVTELDADAFLDPFRLAGSHQRAGLPLPTLPDQRAGRVVQIYSFHGELWI